MYNTVKARVHFVLCAVLVTQAGLVAGGEGSLLPIPRITLQQKDFPALFVFGQIRSDNLEGFAAREIFDQLEKRGFAVIKTLSAEEETTVYDARQDLSCLVVAWDSDKGREAQTTGFIKTGSTPVGNRSVCGAA